MGSKAVTYEALQAVVQMVQKAPKMSSVASVWAPPVYKRLLSADKRDRDMAERCLKDVESSLLPPSPSLSKVVAVDISQSLLSVMEKMARSRAFVVPTIRAWSWLVRLLGSQAGENRVLVNQMLKVAEVTFTSHESQIQIASLVAWEALIDALFQYPTLQGNDLQQKTDTVFPLSENFQKSYASPSVKRLKLLMMPLITIMRSASLESVRFACWRTWTYLSHKLELEINSVQVQAVVVLPMFEVIFKSGPERGTPGVWDFCLNALEALIVCKFQDKLDLCSTRANFIGLEGRVSSPKTPTLTKSAENEAETLPIKWVPWSLESLDSILRLIRLLWICGVQNLKQSSSDNLSLNGAIRMLYLVVKGVDGEGKGVVKPSVQNVKSVQTVLKFVSELSSESELLAGLKEPVSTLWLIFEVLLQFGYLVLCSSFYKLSFLHPNSQLKKGHDPLKISSPKESICLPISSGELVTPIAYIIGMWVQVGCAAFCKNEEESKALERLVKLAECTKAGLGIMNNLQGVGFFLEWFYSHMFSTRRSLGVQKDVLTNTEAIGTLTGSQLWSKGYYFLRVWRIFACQMASYIESSNDVPAYESGIGDSGYEVVHKFLLLPLEFCLSISDLPSGFEGVSHSGCKDTERVRLPQSSNELDLVVAAWTRLYDCSSRVSSLKSSEPNSFASVYCQKVLQLLDAHWHSVHHNGVDEHAFSENYLLSGLLSIVVKHVLRETDISSLATLAMNRKKRLGSFLGGSCLSNGVAGNDIEDTSNIREILCLTSRLLDLAWNELTAGKTWWSSSASRVITALAGFASRLYSQQDALIFLQDFSRPLAKWLRFSDSSLIKQKMPSYSKVLWQALQDLWEKLLSLLRRCQPPLIYNSNLLSLQAPLLIPAFEHSESLISNSTLSFWEATYGSKASFLKYPPCLVPVLQQLKEKVKISLPGWEKNGDLVLKGRTELDQTLEVALETPTRRSKHLRMCQEMSLEKRNSFGKVANIGSRPKLDEMCTSMNLHGSSSHQIAKAKSIDKPLDALLEKIKRPVGKSHATAAGTGIAEGGLNSAEDRSDRSKNVLISTNSVQPTDTIEEGACVLNDRIGGEDRSDQSAEVKNRDEGLACMKCKVTQTIKEPPKKSAPNVISSTEAGETPVLPCHNAPIELREHLAPPCHDALATDCNKVLQLTRSEDAPRFEWDSGASARRKKLRFLDDEFLEYATIPLTQKKAGPLTDHQKEVRKAQSGTIGSECTSHGAGVKTYTNMDFSQSQIVFDSEDPDDVVLEISDQVVKDGEKLKDLDSSLIFSNVQSKQHNESMVVWSPEKGHSSPKDAIPSGLTLLDHNIKLPNQTIPQCSSAVDSTEHNSMPRKRSEGEMQGFESVTPSKVLRSGRKLASVADSDIRRETNLIGSCSDASTAVISCKSLSANASVERQLGSNMNNLEVGLPHEKCNKDPQHQQGDWQSGLNMCNLEHKLSYAQCKEPQYKQGKTRLGSLVYDCMEQEVLGGQTQPLVADTQPCDTQICDTQPCGTLMHIAALGSDNKQCSYVTIALKQRDCPMDDTERSHVSNAFRQRPKLAENFAGKVGTKWAICNLLTAANTSSQWRNMDLESLECAEKLITDLRRQVHESKMRLFD